MIWMYETFVEREAPLRLENWSKDKSLPLSRLFCQGFPARKNIIRSKYPQKGKRGQYTQLRICSIFALLCISKVSTSLHCPKEKLKRCDSHPRAQM